jgi:predicted type IV restriction endonuclease
MMDFAEKINEIANRYKKMKDNLATEEATKQALVLPFLQALGYDVYNPLEVIPEFTADVGIKKGEKVDYAIKKDDQVVLLFECKRAGTSLSKQHCAQLFRYFSVTEARFGILTNGVDYEFYSDTVQQNKMDDTPFFVFNILNLDDQKIEELKKFSRDNFDLDQIVNTASNLMYLNATKNYLTKQMNEPDDDFVKFLAKGLYEGRVTPAVFELFQKTIKQSFFQLVNDRVKDRLKTALKNENLEEAEDEAIELIDLNDDDGIETTPEEIEGFNIIKAIVRQVVSCDRIVMRDNKSYCAVLLDDNNRKPICRMRFNSAIKRLGVFNGKDEEKYDIETLDDLFKYEDQLKKTVLGYVDKSSE